MGVECDMINIINRVHVHLAGVGWVSVGGVEQFRPCGEESAVTV